MAGLEPAALATITKNEFEKWLPKVRLVTQPFLTKQQEDLIAEKKIPDPGLISQ
ncbi:hypothetical protein BH09VER1_BH09VER1_15240 [soil metagenome]